jgi:hypothetical protein
VVGAGAHFNWSERAFKFSSKNSNSARERLWRAGNTSTEIARELCSGDVGAKRDLSEIAVCGWVFMWLKMFFPESLKVA